MIEHRTTITLPIYNYRIFVIFTDNLIGSADKLAKQGMLVKGHGIDDTTKSFHVRMANQSYSFIVLKNNIDIDTIVHEVYHAVSTLMRWISATHEEELFAYHMGYITACVVADQKKAKKKRVR